MTDFSCKPWTMKGNLVTICFVIKLQLPVTIPVLVSGWRSSERLTCASGNLFQFFLISVLGYTCKLCHFVFVPAVNWHLWVLSVPWCPTLVCTMSCFVSFCGLFQEFSSFLSMDMFDYFSCFLTEDVWVFCAALSCQPLVFGIIKS